MTFSQGKEDTYIASFFGLDEADSESEGVLVYVELGAFDGITNSNTRALQLRGWSGVCIEPNPTAFKKLLKNRADDRTACYDVACVSDPKLDSVRFTVFDSIPQFSGLAPDPSKTIPEASALRVPHTPKTITVKAMTLDAILLDYFGGEYLPIDFLSVDVEGTEQDALAGFNFDVWIPVLVCIENNDNRNKGIDDFMRARGYKVATKLGINTFYERA